MGEIVSLAVGEACRLRMFEPPVLQTEAKPNSLYG